MRPVMEGMCLFESLLNCTIGIEHLAKMNAALDVRDENKRRAEERDK